MTSSASRLAPLLSILRRVVLLGCVVLLSLQAAWLVRMALMAWVDPSSTALQRSQAWQLARQAGRPLPPRWDQRWVPLDRIAPGLPRAVIASEDGQFVRHRGVDWRSLMAAWRRHQRPPAAAPSGSGSADGAGAGAARVVGGSTLTQQLAKNLFLSGERTLWRKGQELVLALALEAMLDKQRLLELYLNHVEWGEGVFGAEAAAQRYFQRPALALDARQSARLAVMLPAPRRFEKQPDSAYLNQRTQVILGRMQAAQIPPAR